MNWREFQARQRVVELGPRFVSYIDEGEGAPVVLLHGIPTWGFLFHDLISALSPRRRILVPDMPGFGFSDKRDNFDRSIGRQAEALIAWLDVLGIPKVDLVAHDIGGGVALRLATLHPQRIGRLCIMNGVCYDSWPIEMMLQFGLPEVRRKMSASQATAMLKKALKAGFGSAPKDEILDGLLAPYTTEVGKTSLIRNAAALNANLTTEITALLPRISSETLLLWGEDDTFQPAKFGKRLAVDIPQARWMPIAEAKHFVMIDAPERVARELQEFLYRE